MKTFAAYLLAFGAVTCLTLTMTGCSNQPAKKTETKVETKTPEGKTETKTEKKEETKK